MPSWDQARSRDVGPVLGRGRTADVFAWDPGTVLKLFHEGFPDGLTEQEALATAVAAQDEAAPRLLGTVSVDGRRGIVLERVTGPTLAAAARSRPWRMARYARLLADLHLAMHSRHAPRLDPQRDRLAASIMGAPGLGDRRRRLVLERLPDSGEDDRLCHGDFHPDNVVLTRRGPVVIDWMTATRGAPAADVARTAFLLGGGALPPGTARAARAATAAGRGAFRALYLRRYLRAGTVAPGDVEAWTLPIVAARLAEGIASERAGLLVTVDAEVARRTTGG